MDIILNNCKQHFITLGVNPDVIGGVDALDKAIRSRVDNVTSWSYADGDDQLIISTTDTNVDTSQLADLGEVQQ